MWNPTGQNVSFCVIAPEKEVNSVNITNHEWICAIEATSWPWVSICLLRLRGKVPSSLEMFSGVLKISSSLSCSSFSCWINTQEQNQVLFLWHFQIFNWSPNLCWGFLKLLSCYRSVGSQTLSSTLQTLPLSLQEDGLPRGPVLQRKVAHSSTEIFCFDFSHHSFGIAQEQEERVESVETFTGNQRFILRCYSNQNNLQNEF